MSKTSGKREKLACASMGHLPKLQKPKMESGEEYRRRCVAGLHGKRPNFRGHIQSATHIYKIVIMDCRIAKMPLLALNVGPFTQMIWK